MNAESIFVLIACILSCAVVIYVPIWQIMENRKDKTGGKYASKKLRKSWVDCTVKNSEKVCKP
jgi:hypothetical protein